MKVLVLGGSGFIGTNLVTRLASLGYDIRVFGHIPVENHEPVSKVEYQNGSLSDSAAVSLALHEVDIVIHLISSSIPRISNFNSVDDIRDNLMDTVALLECMRKLGVRRIIYTSSGGTIYGDSQKELINEDHPKNPNCSYGIVKLAVEKYLLMYERLYGFEPVILRVSNPYGPRQKKIGVQGLIGTLLIKAIKQEPIQIWGDGEVIRDYLYINDLVNACECIINQNITGIFNVGSGMGYSVNQVIKLVEEATSLKLDITYAQACAEDVRKVVLDIRKIKNELNWIPVTSFHEGVSKYYAWLQSSQ